MFSKWLLTLTQALCTLHTRAKLQKCLGIVKGKKNKNNKNNNEGGRVRVFGSVVCLGKVVKGYNVGFPVKKWFLPLYLVYIPNSVKLPLTRSLCFTPIPPSNATDFDLPKPRPAVSQESQSFHLVNTKVNTLQGGKTVEA